MPSFNTVTGLINYMMKDIEKAFINEINDELIAIMRSAIRDKVYGRQVSGMYNRTYTLLQSVDARIQSGKSTEVNVDLWNNQDKMSYTYPSVGKGSEDNRDKIVRWINDGHGGIWHYSETRYIEEARRNVEVSLSRLLREALAKRGIKVVK